MKHPYQIDLGVVHIHTNVVADIVASTVADVDGVSLVAKTFVESCGELFGKRVVPGVTVDVDENNDVSVNIQVVVRYGMNIPDIGRHIQDVVRSVVQKTVDISLKEININIQGIERGQQ